MPLFNPNTSTNTCTAYIKPGLEQNVNRWKFEGKFDSNGDYPQEAIHKAVEKLHEHTEKLTTSIPQTDQTIIDALTKIKAMASSIEAGMIGNDGSGKASYSEYYVKQFMITGFSDYEQFVELATRAEIPLPLRETAIKNLASAHNVCADGILSNIESAVQELIGASQGAPANFYHSLIRSIDAEILLWLNMRRTYPDARHHQVWNALSNGNEIHTANQIFNIIAPHFGLEQRKDSNKPALPSLTLECAEHVKSKVTENIVVTGMANQCLDNIHNLYKSEGLVPGASYTCKMEYSKASAVHERVMRELSQSYGRIELSDYFLLTEDAIEFTISTDSSLIEKRIIKNLKLADIFYHKSADILWEKGDPLRIKKSITSYYVVESQDGENENTKTYSSLQHFLQKSEEHVRKIEEKLAQEGSLASNIFNLNITKDGSVRLIYDTVNLIKNKKFGEAIAKNNLIWTSDLVDSREIGLITLSILKTLSKSEYKENCREFIQLLPSSIVPKVVKAADHSSEEFKLFYELLSNKMIQSGVGSSTGNQSIIRYVLEHQETRSGAVGNLLKIMTPQHYADLVNTEDGKPAIPFESLEISCGLDTALQYFKLLTKYHEARANFSMEGFFHQSHRPEKLRHVPLGLNFEELKPPVDLINYLLSDIASKDLEDNFSYITREIEKKHSETLIIALAERISKETHSPYYLIDFIKKLSSKRNTATSEHPSLKKTIYTLSNSLNITPSDLFASSINGTPDPTLLELLIDGNCSSTLERIASDQKQQLVHDFPPGTLEFWLVFTLNSLSKSRVSENRSILRAFDKLFSHTTFDVSEFKITNTLKFKSDFSRILTRALSLGLEQTAVCLMEMANSVESEGLLDDHDTIRDLIEKHSSFESPAWHSITKFTQKHMGMTPEFHLKQNSIAQNYSDSDEESSDWELASTASDYD